MRDNKNAWLYLDSFDENNMFDFEYNIKLYYVSEMLRSKMCHRIEKPDLNYCGDAIFTLIDLTVKITAMIDSKNLVCCKRLRKLFDGVIQNENNRR